MEWKLIREQRFSLPETKQDDPDQQLPKYSLFLLIFFFLKKKIVPGMKLLSIRRQFKQRTQI
jgi:hypothetical protein